MIRDLRHWGGILVLLLAAAEAEAVAEMGFFFVCVKTGLMTDPEIRYC